MTEIKVFTQEELDKALAEKLYPILCGDGKFEISDSSQVTAGEYVAITRNFNFRGKITGGVVIIIPEIKTLEDWCNFYGVEQRDGVVTLFKAVDENFKSPHGTSYAPGETPSAPDWDGGKEECGGGLHFSPTPFHALKFNRDAKKFVACQIKTDEIVVFCPAQYPDKVKAPRVFAPCYEVDIKGAAH